MTEVNVHLRKLISIGLAAALCLLVAVPAFAQSGENKEYQAIQDERDTRKQISMIETFVGAHPSSQFRPEVDITLLGRYLDNKDWAKIVRHADTFAITQGAADAKARSTFFTLAMEGARQLGNAQKTEEFAGRALTADPNNISVMMTMARTYAEGAPADAAAMAANMTKAMTYAEKAQKAFKPANLSDSDWDGVQGRLHGILGVIHYNKKEWPDAATEFADYLKANPTDGLGQFRYGLTMYAQLQQTLASLSSTNTDARAAQAAGADDLKIGFYADKLTSLNKEFETRRDITIDAMAKALAIGGGFAEQANTVIQPLFKQKTDSLDGLPEYISTKKAELQALRPVIVAPPAARGGAATAGRGGAAPAAGAGARAGGR